jgi:hypothetical protein
MAKKVTIQQPVTETVVKSYTPIEKWQSDDGQYYATEKAAKARDETIRIDKEWQNIPKQQIPCYTWLSEESGDMYILRIRNESDARIIKKKFPWCQYNLALYIGEVVIILKYEYESNSYDRYSGLGFSIWDARTIQEEYDKITKDYNDFLNF